MQLRYWDIDRQEMVYMIGGFTYDPAERKIWSYSLGVPDKNGREVYTGDFVGDTTDFIKSTLAGDAERLLVGIEDGCMKVGRRQSVPKAFDTYLWLIADKVEVLGNRWENPEWLYAQQWEAIDMPRVIYSLNGEEKQVQLHSEGEVHCSFCNHLTANRYGRIGVTDKCSNCGAEVVDI